MHHLKTRLRLIVTIFWVGASLLLPVTAVAASKPATAAPKNAPDASTEQTVNNVSSAVTQSYNADATVEIGMIVRLKPKDTSSVVPLDNTQIQNLLGVVVPTGNATVVITPAHTTKQQVLVATSGHFQVIVSNQNGPIKAGDYVTVSSLSGVGMKAGDGQEQVVGKATAAFTGTANVIGSVDLKDTLGRKNTVALGRIPINVAISHNPLFQKNADYVPAFLAKAAVTVASKPVSAARIYLCMAVLFASILITGNMLYSGVRSGMIAVGRNPLSKKSIIMSLIQTVVAGLIIFVVGVIAVYLLLKL